MTNEDRVNARLKQMKKENLIELVYNLASRVESCHNHNLMFTSIGYVPCTADNFIAVSIGATDLIVGEDYDE